MSHIFGWVAYWNRVGSLWNIVKPYPIEVKPLFFNAKILSNPVSRTWLGHFPPTAESSLHGGAAVPQQLAKLVYS